MTIPSLKEITFFIPALPATGGGAQQIFMKLMSGFIGRGIKVTLVLAILPHDLHRKIPAEVEIVHLKCKRTVYSIIKLTRYIKKHKPRNILSHLHRANRIVLLSKLLARSDVRVHVVEHHTVSEAFKEIPTLHKIVSYISYKLLYRYTANIIHVSKTAAKDLQEYLPNVSSNVRAIYNPVVSIELLNGHTKKPPHRWFLPGNPPVILGVGRLDEVKDFNNLIDSFMLIRKQKDVRLIILGEGVQRKQLEEKLHKYNIVNEVLLPGYVTNPYHYMRYASVFALSSRTEALPTVLIEAMACGCPVVSTDCPGGAAEILEYGKYGVLVPIQDPNALANAILKTINNPISIDLLKKRAMDFSIDKSVDEYIKVISKT